MDSQQPFVPDPAEHSQILEGVESQQRRFAEARQRDYDRAAERRYETWLEECKDHGP